MYEIDDAIFFSKKGTYNIKIKFPLVKMFIQLWKSYDGDIYRKKSKKAFIIREDRTYPVYFVEMIQFTPQQYVRVFIASAQLW